MRSFRLFLFFLVGAFLSGCAVIALAGDWKAPIPAKSALELCRSTSQQSSSYPVIVEACQYDPQLPQCPSSKDGGTCEESAYFKYKPTSTAISSYVVSTPRVKYTYCPDSAPRWNGTACVPSNPCEGKGGTEVDDGSVGPNNVKLALSFPIREDGNYVGQFFCSGGCEASVTREIGAIGIGMGGRYYNTFGAKFDGLQCAPPGVSVGPGTLPVSLIQKTSKEYDCVASGKAYGYVNNVVVCVDPNTKGGKAQQTNEKKNADGTTTKTVVDKTVTCTGAGSCTTITTTTTTVYNADGSQKSTSQETTTDKDEGKGNGASGTAFCKENPSSAICRSGTFSGSCESSPSCDGDPIQCATARSTWETNCKTMRPGEIRQAPDVGVNNIQQNFEHSDLGGGGACPAPRSVNILGSTVTFEMTPICEFAAGIRPVVILLGWIAAGYIVMGYGRSSSQS